LEFILNISFEPLRGYGSLRFAALKHGMLTIKRSKIGTKVDIVNGDNEVVLTVAKGDFHHAAFER
jgi:hypothetical protein